MKEMALRALSAARAMIGPDPIAKLAFGAGMAVILFFAGAVAMEAKVFPYRLVKDSRAALGALAKLEPSNRPIGVVDFEPNATGPSARRLDPGAGTEHILLAGGFYQYMDICPTYGCIAVIVDRTGAVVHAWEADLKELLEGDALADFYTGVERKDDNNVFVWGVALEDNGDLIVTLHGANLFPYQVGIAKYDVSGKLLWKRIDHSHHWATVDRTGEIFVPYSTAVKDLTTFGATATEIHCAEGSVSVEGVRVLTPGGEVEREMSFADIFQRSDYPGLLYAVRNGCDPFHVNAVVPVPEAGARRFPTGTVEAGDLLVSLREPSALAVIDREDGTMKALIGGRAAGQHSPRFLPDGTIVVFDNQGGRKDEGGTRILRIDPATTETEVVYPRKADDPLLPFHAPTAGVLDISPDGDRILVADPKGGRVFEILVATGAPLWVYDKVLDIGPYLAKYHESQKDRYARFGSQGAYYVPDLDILQRTPDSGRGGVP